MTSLPHDSFFRFVSAPRFRAIRALAFLCLGAGAAALCDAAPSRWPTSVDVDPGETVTAVRDGVSHTFRILNDEGGQPAIAYETMPFPTTSVDKRVNYAVRVRLAVDGKEIEMVARPYQFPIEAAGLRLYLDGTKEWLGTDDVFPVNIAKRIRLAFTAAGESWGPPALRFPVGEYRWYSTSYNNTWLGIVPQGLTTTYYHKGEDFGAVPDRLPVLASEAGEAKTEGTGVQTVSGDGTLFWMSHLNAHNVFVTSGERVVAGQKLGLTGNRGNSDDDPHVHYDINRRSDMPGSYPYLVESYLRDYPDAGIPVAGGYQFMWAGDTLQLDARRSIARPGRTITGYRWILHDGTTVNGPTASLTATTEGFYAQELRVFFDDGREERGFTQVRVFKPKQFGQMPITGFLYQYPVRGIQPGDEISIRHHEFLLECNARTIDFGDGSAVQTVTGARPTINHVFAAPGLYTVTVHAIGTMPQVLKTSVLVESAGSGPNRPPTIAGLAERQFRCFSDHDLTVVFVGSDPDGDPLAWEAAQAPAHGAVTLDAAGTVHYRPTPGFAGDDTFTVRLVDGMGGTASVRCSVVVCPLPLAGASGMRIEAEDYDEGGEGVAFHDVDARQGPSRVRTDGSSHDVDIVAIEPGADFPGLKVGYTEPGEWLRYTLTVPVTGSYDVRLRVSNGSGITSSDAISLRWKGEVVAELSVPATGGWDTFTDLDVPGVLLSAGTDLLQFDCNTGGFDCNWIELVPAPAPLFASWIEGYFPGSTGDPAIVGATADPDGDGVNNLGEYGLGRVPNVAEPPLAPTVWTDTGTGGQYLTLTFRRTRGVAVVAEISDDLVAWSSAVASLVQVGTAVPDATGLYETVTYRSTATTAAKPRQFLRVRVTLP